MTIVELYDDKPINNIVGTLAFNPEKVIYVGGYSKKHFYDKKMPVLRNYLFRKGYESLIIEYVQVRRDSLKDIVEKLEGIYSSNQECKFHVEVTGGEDLILIGLGVLCQRYPEIELYQISSKLRNIRSFSMSSDDDTKLDIDCTNSVEENLLLHGASIISANGSNEIPGGYAWKIEFFHYVEVMWDICCHGIEEDSDGHAPYYWNKVTTVLSFLEAEDENETDSNTITAKNSILKSKFSNDYDFDLFYNYIYYLVRCDLMDCKLEADFVKFIFKNEQVKACLTKAGLILELKTYLICSELLRGTNGDCLTSVTIDWDGDDDISSNVKYLYDADDPSSTIDTTNEIDVLANFGLVPYFISCKNGKFTSEELYKLNSVGEQFGKGYSVKIIVATDIDFALGGAKNVILQRAADMGIRVISGVHEMSDEEFKEELIKKMELPKSNRTAKVKV